MIAEMSCPIHPRHAILVEDLQDYLRHSGKSARWLGLTVAKDPRLLPNLKRGQHYPASVMHNLYLRMLAFHEERLAVELALTHGLPAFVEQRLAA